MSIRADSDRAPSRPRDPIIARFQSADRATLQPRQRRAASSIGVPKTSTGARQALKRFRSAQARVQRSLQRAAKHVASAAFTARAENHPDAAISSRDNGALPDQRIGAIAERAACKGERPDRTPPS